MGVSCRSDTEATCCRLRTTQVSPAELTFAPEGGRCSAGLLVAGKKTYRVQISTQLCCLNLHCFCLRRLHYSSPSSPIVKKLWLRECCGKSKSRRCWRAARPLHLHPCIKYELASPVTELSAPPGSRPLSNALISAWVTGEPLRLLIYSLLFKDLFVLGGRGQDLSAGRHPWKEAVKLEACPLLLQLGALSVIRLF